MRRIDDHTVEFTDAEMIILEVRDRLLDQGMGIAEATRLITGATIPDTLREETFHLDRILTDEFLAYLND